MDRSIDRSNVVLELARMKSDDYISFALKKKNVRRVATFGNDYQLSRRANELNKCRSAVNWTVCSKTGDNRYLSNSESLKFL